MKSRKSSHKTLTKSVITLPQIRSSYASRPEKIAKILPRYDVNHTCWNITCDFHGQIVLLYSLSSGEFVIVQKAPCSCFWRSINNSLFYVVVHVAGTSHNHYGTFWMPSDLDNQFGFPSRGASYRPQWLTTPCIISEYGRYLLLLDAPDIKCPSYIITLFCCSLSRKPYLLYCMSTIPVYFVIPTGSVQ